MSAPSGLRLSRAPGNGRLLIALSPDGEKLAAIMFGKDAVRRIFVRRFQDTTFRELLGTEREVLAEQVAELPAEARGGVAEQWYR